MRGVVIDSAALKIERAEERIAEVGKLLRETPPFVYVVHTNTYTNERSTRPKRNETLVNRCGLICGEAVHGMRSALDHAYWEIVSPFAITPKEQRAVQFPFCERADRLDEAIKNRLAHRVSTRFFDAIFDLKPYQEQGGNRLLALIDVLDVSEKHRKLTPVANYTLVTSDMIKLQAPDFPMTLNATFGDSIVDVMWQGYEYDRSQIGELVPPHMGIFEKKLNVPVDVVIRLGPDGDLAPMVPTLNSLVEVAKETIRIIRAAAA
jgi:hypothetical protein